MTAEPGEGPTQAPAAEPATPGELLRRERERRALSIRQAAESLHLDTWMIEALETNRFLALGAPVYAKGHLRNYAMLLGLSPDLVIRRYESLSDTPIVPTPVPATVAPARRQRPSLKAPLWILAGVLAIAVAWWVFELLTNQPAEAPAVEVEPLAAPAPETLTTAPADGVVR